MAYVQKRRRDVVEVEDFEDIVRNRMHLPVLSFTVTTDRFRVNAMWNSNLGEKFVVLNNSNIF